MAVSQMLQSRGLKGRRCPGHTVSDHVTIHEFQGSHVAFSGAQRGGKNWHPDVLTLQSAA